MDNSSSSARSSGPDDLSGITGIGPARRAALAAAGVTTRAELARMTIEQLVSASGLGRAQAEAVLAAARKSAAPRAETVPLTDEAFPAAPQANGAAPPPTPPASETLEGAEAARTAHTPVLPDEDQDPAVAARATLDRAAVRARSAVSDASRVWTCPKLEKSLTRLAVALDGVTGERINALRPKSARRLAESLDSLAGWLEKKAAAGAAPLTGKKLQRARDRLKTGRQALADTLKAGAVAAARRKRKTAGKR